MESRGVWRQGAGALALDAAGPNNITRSPLPRLASGIAGVAGGFLLRQRGDVTCGLVRGLSQSIRFPHGSLGLLSAMPFGLFGGRLGLGGLPLGGTGVPGDGCGLAGRLPFDGRRVVRPRLCAELLQLGLSGLRGGAQPFAETLFLETAHLSNPRSLTPPSAQSTAGDCREIGGAGKNHFGARLGIAFEEVTVTGTSSLAAIPTPPPRTAG